MRGTSGSVVLRAALIMSMTVGFGQGVFGGGLEEGPPSVYIRRLPKTAHTLFTLGLLPARAVSTGLLYIPLEP